MADYVLRLRPSLESFVLSPAQRPFADRLISANRKGFSVDCGIAASLRRGDATVHGVDYPNIPLVEGRPAGFRKNPHPPAGHAPIQAHLTASEMLGARKSEKSVEGRRRAAALAAAARC